MSRPCEERERRSNPGAKCWTTEGFPLDGFASLAMTAVRDRPRPHSRSREAASGSQGKGLNALSFALDPGPRCARPGMWHLASLLRRFETRCSRKSAVADFATMA